METLIIIALVLTSVTAATFIVERALALRVPKVIPPPLEDAVLNYNSGRDMNVLKAVCTQNPSPLSRLLLFACDHLDLQKTENTSLIETRARYEISKLERGLVILEIIVGVAPLMGLVGTIIGLIMLFASVDVSAASGNKQFTTGISTALVATLLGLVIAIPALIAWSYFSRKVETYAVRMEALCDEFLRKHYRTNSIVAANATPAVSREATPGKLH